MQDKKSYKLLYNFVKSKMDYWTSLKAPYSSPVWLLYRRGNYPTLEDIQNNNTAQFWCLFNTFTEESHPEINSLLCEMQNKSHRTPKKRDKLKKLFKECGEEVADDSEWGLSKVRVDEIIKGFHDQDSFKLSR